jgi:cysteine desulfurase
MGARPQEIVFTSGATEANNLAIQGLANAVGKEAHIISSPTEHPAVLEPLRALQHRGWDVSFLTVDEHGEIDIDEVRDCIGPNTALITLMAANNEIGTLHPVRRLAEVARSCGIPFHTDAAQAVGKIPIDLDTIGVDYLSLSAHKFYGPQGVGALFVRRSARAGLSPLLRGGGQENGLRSGTLNTPGIVGLGAAAAHATDRIVVERARTSLLRDKLCGLLQDGWPDIRVNGPQSERRLPGSLHVTFPGLDAEAIMANCPGVAMASGSACASAAPGPSHVLSAIGMTAELADASLRMSVGRYTTEEDVETAASAILAAVRRVQDLTTEPAAASIGER